MARTWQDRRWVALARSAAADIGASHDEIVAAILAQWQCEQPSPAPWPPVHNNPGNLTRDIGTLDGEPHTLATHGPGVGFLYQYATPASGARAYASYLLRSRHYPTAIAAARKADAERFLAAVCTHGYGTRLTCVLRLLPAARTFDRPLSGSRFACMVHAVNVRAHPNTSARITGTIKHDQVVLGRVVVGSSYNGPDGRSAEWIELAGPRYTGRAFYRKA